MPVALPPSILAQVMPPRLRRRIDALHAASDAFRDALAVGLEAINGQRGNPASFDQLDGLLDDQSYRLAFWRVAAEEINYRRFFDITELAAVRMEDPAVFADTHRLLMRLIGEKIESVITRILGVILAALAAQFVIDGLRQSFPAFS